MIDLVRSWFWPAVGVSMAMSLFGLVLAGWLIVTMPADHFIRPYVRPPDRHPLLHLLWVLFRNLLGLLLIALGLAMLIGPGQGLLTLLLGVSIMDLPAKHRAMEWALTLKSVRKSLNWMRRRAGRPALQFPPKRDDPPVTQSDNPLSGRPGMESLSRCRPESQSEKNPQPFCRDE